MVITGPDNLFALADVGELLRAELDRARSLAARLPGGRALLVQACAANRELPLDAAHLAFVRLHAGPDCLHGDVVCRADALPWEDDAFQLVVVQHAGDALPLLPACVDEFARILAPGGVLLWFGLNPWSPWLTWRRWRARHGPPPPRTTHVDAVRRLLLLRHLKPAATQYVGACWPRGEHSGAGQSRLLAPLRCAYLLGASKQRIVLTPLRARNTRDRVATRPQLAGTPSRRACT